MRTGAVDPLAVAVIALPLGLVAALLSWSVRRRRGRSVADAWIDGGLVASLVGVLLATFTPLSEFGETSTHPRAIQLVPLERLDGAPVEFAVINLLLLAPVAFLLVLRGRRAGFLPAVFACVGLSILIELLQLFHPSRGTNVDDVLLNSLGALGGATLGGLARWVRPTTRAHRADRRRRGRGGRGTGDRDGRVSRPWPAGR
jgi:glycopeptide antibiotics resistance protein